MPDPTYALLNLAYVARPRAIWRAHWPAPSGFTILRIPPRHGRCSTIASAIRGRASIAAPYREELIQALREAWGNARRAIARWPSQSGHGAPSTREWRNRCGGRSCGRSQHDELLLAMMDPHRSATNACEHVLSAARAALLREALDPAPATPTSAIIRLRAGAPMLPQRLCLCLHRGGRPRAADLLSRHDRCAAVCDSGLGARGRGSGAAYLPLHRLDGCDRLLRPAMAGAGPGPRRAADPRPRAVARISRRSRA